ncbi:MAG: hypothetical protein K9K64_06320 [Desulfohalobiaceae bacterium]|nr:hypothetical protein [Desulfohalobiaceae bacterium]
MLVKRVLILAPVLLTVFLLQSYFWVPTYEEQARGHPERLQEFITASSGDASILNPILSADSASSDIENKVFEGLIDLDKDLEYRGRLARSWDISEQALFYVNPEFPVPGQGRLTAGQTARFLRKAKAFEHIRSRPLKKTLQNIKAIEPVSPKAFQVKTELPEGQKEIVLQVTPPKAVRLDLFEVDPELFDNLEFLLGQGYFQDFPQKKHIKSENLSVSKADPDLLARALPPFEHNPVLVFHLRDGVRFHDGHRFDAGDVKFTYQAIVDPENISPRVADFEPVKSVEVVDELTLRIVYKRLYSPALNTWSIGILPEHLLNEKALNREAAARGLDPEEFSLRDSRFNRSPVGCGPFEFSHWESDQYIKLTSFADYWEGEPNYQEYVYRIVPDLLTQEMEFYAGTLDSYSVQPHQVERLKQDPRFQSFSGTSFGYTYIGYNMRRKPFTDRRVRRALSLAINVQDIIEYVLYGQGERISGPFVKQTDFYNQDIQPVEYDPEKALRLLDRAGWKRNSRGWLEKDGRVLSFTLITNSGNEIRKSILAIVQDFWKRIGVKVSTDTLEWSVFIQERVNKLDFDALILGWNMGIEPDLYQIWHSSQSEPFELNFVGFDHQEADELIVKIRQEYDRAEQVDYCRRLHEIIAFEQPYTFLFVQKWTALLDKRIVIREVDEKGEVVYKKITPTKTGNYSYYFNKWVKLPRAPEFAAE